MELDSERFLKAVAKFPPPAGVHFSYGTAGFRTDASLLDSTTFRVGILAALRSLSTRSTIGVMITASHNPIHDNGVKIADPNGDMLSQAWEPFAESLANAGTPQIVLQAVVEFMHKNDIFRSDFSNARVFIGRDTRPSGERLSNAAKQGVEAVTGVSGVVVGVLTTPQLHWMVRACNQGLGASEQDYFVQLSHGFRCLLDMKPEGKGFKIPQDGFIVDAANGVGASKLFELQKLVKGLKLDIRNCGKEGDGLLNELVGADFIQKERGFPRGFGRSSELARRCASLDGDADRIVFFYSEQAEGAQGINLKLLDGDKILTLFAIFIKQQSEELCRGASGVSSIEFGVVQTAYANGASTRFLKENLGVQVALTSTGVKYLHHKAAEYDIGLYFEANGHGTVLFREEFLQALRKSYPPEMRTDIVMEAPWNAAQRLLAISKVVNQAIGDALSVLLLVEVVLHYMGLSIQDWNSIYTDLPSRQLKGLGAPDCIKLGMWCRLCRKNKRTRPLFALEDFGKRLVLVSKGHERHICTSQVKVQDRAVIRTTNAETRVTHPAGLQAAIDMEVDKARSGRAFVRPSGTEDIVRVYAEAETQEEADLLARSIAVHVHELANGVDNPP